MSFEYAPASDPLHIYVKWLNTLASSRCRAMREQLKVVEDFHLKNESNQNQNLALTVLYVPRSFDSYLAPSGLLVVVDVDAGPVVDW